MGNDVLPTAAAFKNNYKGMLQKPIHARKMSADVSQLSSLSQNSWDEYCKINSDETDHESCGGSVSQLHVNEDIASSESYETLSLERSDARLNEASLLLENDRANVTEDLNKSNPETATTKASCLSEASGPVALLLETTAETDCISVLLQHTLQSLAAANSYHAEESGSVSWFTIRTDMSVGEQSLSAWPGGHTYSRSSGARPKLVVARTITRSSKSRNSKNNVRWCEEYISTVDAKTYELYKKNLLEISIPNTAMRNVVTEAVLFMLDKEEIIHLALIIDMALKFLWVKHGRCPTAAILYSTICDFEYDEKNIVLAFLEMCQAENERAAINAGLQDLLSYSEEPLRALDFQILAQGFQVQNTSDFHLQAEGHRNSEINKLSLLKGGKMPEKQHNKLLTEKDFKHEQVKVLQTEHEFLKASMMCVLCRKKPIEVTLLPCGHFVLCAACSDDCNVCPVCNKQALAEVKTFLC